MAEVVLTANASQLIQQLERSAAAFANFNAATANVTRDLGRLDAAGNVATRAITAVDAAGNRVTGTFERVNNTFQLVRNSVSILAGETQQFVTLQQANARIAEITARVQDQSASAYARAAAQAELAAAQTERLAAAQRQLQPGVAVGTPVEPATPLNTPARAVFGGDDRVPGQVGSTVDLADERESLLLTRERARALADARIEALRGVAASQQNVEVSRALRRNEEAIRDVQERRRRAQLQLNAAAGQETEQARLAQRVLNQRVNDLRLLEADLRNVNNFQERNLELERLQAAAARQRLAVEEQITREEAEQVALQQRQQPSGLLVRPDERAQQQAAAQRLPVELREAAPVRDNAARLEALQADQRINAALNSRASILTRLNALREIAVRRIREAGGAQALFQRGVEATTNATSRLVAGFQSLARIGFISLFVGGLFQIQNALVEATDQALQFSTAIAEIETITNDNSLSTQQWAAGLRELSAEFGLDILDQTEAAYQTLSNQIRNAEGAALSGAQALEFLNSVNRLATVGVTSTASATNLLTSALNAFRLPAEDAERVNAQLFETVRLGRTRIEELGQGFGRVAVPASQLGVSLEELLSTVSTITIQGVQTNEAYTFLRGIFQKLLKPTEDLQRVFGRLGVSSGQALISQEGLVGALALLRREAGANLEEFTGFFNRVRALTGALSLTGENAERAATNLREIQNATGEQFDQNVNRVLESTGRELARARQEAINFFEEGISPLTRAFADFIRDAGGGAAALRSLIDNVVLFTATVGAGVLVFQAFSGAVIAGSAAIVPAAAAAAVVIALIAANTAEANAQAQAFQQTFDQANQQRLEAVDAVGRVEERAANAFLERANRRTQADLRETSERLRNITRRQEALRQESEATEQRFDQTIRNLGRLAQGSTREFERAAQNSTRVAQRAAQEAERILSASGAGRIALDLEIGGSGQDINRLEAEIAAAQEAIATNVVGGDLEAFQQNSRQVQQLLRQREQAEIEFQQQSSQLREQRIQAELAGLNAVSNQERAIAQQRIADIQEQQRLLESGNQRQLENARELSEAFEQARNAETADQFNEASIRIVELQRQQERLNTLAEEERRTRERTLRDQERLAERALEIQRINEERAESARQEAARARSLQLAFDLVSREAAAFNESQIQSAANGEDVVRLAREQLRRFEQLRSLSAQLGGGDVANSVLERRANRFRESAELRLQQLAQERIQSEIAQSRELLEQRVQAERQITEEARQRFIDLRAAAGGVNASLRGFQGEDRGRRLATALGRGDVDDDTAIALETTLDGVNNNLRILSGLLDVQRRTPAQNQAVAQLSDSLRQAILTLDPREIGGGTPQELALVSSLTTTLARLRDIPNVLQSLRDAEVRRGQLRAQTGVQERTRRNFFAGQQERQTAALNAPFNVEQPATQGLQNAARNAQPALEQAAEAAGRRQAETTLRVLREGRNQLSEQSTRPTGRQLPDFQQRRIDRSIQLGRGAPSVQAQQARIQQALNEQAEQRRAVERARRERERQAALQRAAEARARGDVFAGAGGLTVRGASTQGLVGRQTGPRPGTFSGPRPGTFSFAQDTPSGTVQEQQLSEQRRTNTLLQAFGIGTQADAVQALRNEQFRGAPVAGVTGDEFNRPVLPLASDFNVRQRLQQGFAPQIRPASAGILQPSQPTTQSGDVFQISIPSITVEGVQNAREIADQVVPEIERRIRAGRTRIAGR